MIFSRRFLSVLERACICCAALKMNRPFPVLLALLLLIMLVYWLWWKNGHRPPPCTRPGRRPPPSTWSSPPPPQSSGASQPPRSSTGTPGPGPNPTARVRLIEIVNDCEFDAYVAGSDARQRLNTENLGVVFFTVPAKESVAFGAQGAGTGVVTDFIPLYGPSYQRIEVSQFPGHQSEEVLKTWVEMNMTPVVDPGGYIAYQAGVPHASLVSQMGYNSVTMMVEFLAADGGPFCYGEQDANSARFSKMLKQGRVEDCADDVHESARIDQVTAQDGKTTAYICRPYCPDDGYSRSLARNGPGGGRDWPHCEACVLENTKQIGPVASPADHFAAQSVGLNPYAKHVADTSCVWDSKDGATGRWVSTPYTVTMQADEPARAREWSPGLAGYTPWSPNYECWDRMGMGPAGILMGCEASAPALDRVRITLCRAPVDCERPLLPRAGAHRQER
jgi:hypothetical protein